MSIKTKKAVSLFSGAGGLDIGVHQAGFQILGCVEMDPHCCGTLRKNWGRKRPSPQIFERDIRQLEPEVLMQELSLRPGQLDLLFGGPPCQAFSQIGKQLALQDERGLLLFQMPRFASVLRPRFILIEQVKGLLSASDGAGRRGGVLDSLLSRLEALGYTAKWQVLNAAEYGVAQLRRRVFIVAHQKGLKFNFPPATHSATEAGGLFKISSTKTVRDAIGDLHQPVRKGESADDSNHIDVTPAGDRMRIHGVAEGDHLAASFHLPAKQRGRLTRKDTTKFLRAAWSQPSNTLRCGEVFFHPELDRYLTPREYMRIHGYPDSYTLCGPIRGRSGRVRDLDQHRQVANSVPPPLARSLATQILEGLKCQKSTKSLVTA